MILLRCPKFLRCLTADASNFDRGHSLTSLPLPLAALSSLPTSSRRTTVPATKLSVGAGFYPAAIFPPHPIANPRQRVYTVPINIRQSRKMCVQCRRDGELSGGRNDGPPSAVHFPHPAAA